MCKPIRVLFCFFLMGFVLSGCVGFGILTQEECKNETPTTDARRFDPTKQIYPRGKVFSKADFLKAWGKPDMIIPTSENTERWIYERHNLWCGVIPAMLVAIPLVFPACDGFERIDFDGDYAKCLDIKRTVEKGVIIVPGDIVFGDRFHSSACRFSLSDNDSGNCSAKPATQATP